VRPFKGIFCDDISEFESSLCPATQSKRKFLRGYHFVEGFFPLMGVGAVAAHNGGSKPRLCQTLLSAASVITRSPSRSGSHSPRRAPLDDFCRHGFPGAIQWRVSPSGTYRPTRDLPPGSVHLRNRRACHQRGTLVYRKRTKPNSARRKHQGTPPHGPKSP
jgi:hypothetical protein